MALVEAIIDFTDWSQYVGLALGWFMGFVQYAAVAGVQPCAPQAIYTLESAVLLSREASLISTNAFYLSDFITNFGRLGFHTFGTIVYCYDLWTSFFGPALSGTTVPQLAFTWLNYFLVAP